MNKVLKIATVLTWINMIFWGMICLFALLIVLGSGSPALLIFLVFPSAIFLHSYAAFQLQKTIRYPVIPLSKQTPTGIRFIGFVALFVGISLLANGIGFIQDPKEFLSLLQSQWPQELKDSHPLKITQVRAMGIFFLVMGLCVAVNVNLNFRLLRWYYFIRNNSEK